MYDLPRHVVVALVLIRRGDAILLVKQNYGAKYWSLPGGLVEQGESIEQAAVREVREETGLEVRIKRVVGIYSKPAEDALAIALEGELIGGVMNPAAREISDCRYFALDDLPDHTREHFRQRVADFSRDLPHATLRTQ